MSICHNKLRSISSKKIVFITPVFHFVDIFVPGLLNNSKVICKIRARIFRPLIYKNTKALINLSCSYLWWLTYDKRKDIAVDMKLLLLSNNCVWLAEIMLMLFLYILVFQKIHKMKVRGPGTNVWTILRLWIGTCSKCFIGFISELETI